MGIFLKIRRYFDYKILKLKFYQFGINCYKKNKTIEFLNKIKGKKILYMNASPISNQMFQQRPHHFLNVFKNHFDYVFYISYRTQEPKPYKDNIFEVPTLPIIKTNNKIFYYLSSVNCIKLKELKKLKKLNYRIIYDYYDEISDDINDSKNAVRVHKNLNKLDLDIIIATSDKLYKDLIDLGIKNPFLIKNGVTIEDFEKKVDCPPPDIIPALNQPIVGYYGYLANWIDFSLIEQALKTYPKFNFVFIGKFIDEKNHLNLKKYPNYFYLGVKNYKDLYKYSGFFSIAIIPFKLGKIALATSPNKLFEFFALGIPCVCTRDLVECKNYKGVFVSKNEEEFIQDIKNAFLLSNNKEIKEYLKNQAKKNSWNKKANLIVDRIKEIGL